MFYGKYKILTRNQQHMNDTRLTLGRNPVCSSWVETLQARQTTMMESRDRYLTTKALSSQNNKKTKLFGTALIKYAEVRRRVLMSWCTHRKKSKNINSSILLYEKMKEMLASTQVAQAHVWRKSQDQFIKRHAFVRFGVKSYGRNRLGTKYGQFTTINISKY